MNAMHWLGGLVAIALLVYLIAALLDAESF
jgi:K+-transporting ATPase KdpF subunit